MSRYIGLLIVVGVSLTVGLVAIQDRAPTQQEPDVQEPGAVSSSFVPDQILVKIKARASADAMASVNRENDARLEERIPGSRLGVVDIPDDLSVAAAVERYEASPEVEYAEPNYVYQLAQDVPTPSDPKFPQMYDLDNRGQYGGTFDADIDAPEAWKATTGSAETVVAVIDTGVDINHQDLRDNIWTNPGESGVDASGNDKATNGVDDDSNGYVDDVHGWDFYSDDNSVFDGARKDTHATHVAGTIAATGNNEVGVTGVNWQTSIMPLKVVDIDDRFGIHTDDVIEALEYAVRNGAAISNNSWGGGNYGQTLANEIRDADQAGHLFVAAAGNGGTDQFGDDNDTTPFYPASYDNANIISVAASNNEDELTSFSNYGATSVDLAAPGKLILSTYPGNEYGYGEGTSMATPHVTGAAALIKSQQPNLNDTQIKTAILNSVDEIVSLQGKLVTGGRLNAAKALGANTSPVILGVSPAGKIRDRTPTISATVRDDETELTQDQITLYLDGQPKVDFAYDQATDTLTYESSKLARRTHTVQVIANDGDALEPLEESRAWKFKIPRRR